MAPINATLILGVMPVSEMSAIQLKGNATIEWSRDEKGAMIFSVVTILVYGMSIVFFILSEMMRNPNDREREIQVRTYLKKFANGNYTNSLKEEEQRIRAKLLQMSMLGNATQSMYSNNRRHSCTEKISKRRASRMVLPSLNTCLMSNSSGETSPKFSRSSRASVKAALKEFRLVSFAGEGNENSEEDSDDDSDEESYSNETEHLLMETELNEMETNRLIDSILADIPDSIDRQLISPMVQDKTSYMYTDDDNYSLPLEKNNSETQLDTDIEKPGNDITQGELNAIVARRRKRSGNAAPKIELLDINTKPDVTPNKGTRQKRRPDRTSLHISRDSSRENLPRNFSDSRLSHLMHHRGEKSPILTISPLALPFDFPTHHDVYHDPVPSNVGRRGRTSLFPSNPDSDSSSDAEILPAITAVKSKDFQEPQRKISSLAPTHKPKLYRRSQSFRHHSVKRPFVRKGSLEPITACKDIEELTEPMQDEEFVRSLACRRRERRGRISTVCFTPDSDGDSSTDIILPAITIRQKPTEENTEPDLKYDEAGCINAGTEASGEASPVKDDANSASTHPRTERTSDLSRLLSINEDSDNQPPTAFKYHKNKQQRLKQRRSGLLTVQFRKDKASD